MNIEYGKKSLPRNRDEQDFLRAKNILCVFSNSPNPARKTKLRLVRRLRRSSKIIIKKQLHDTDYLHRNG